MFDGTLYPNLTSQHINRSNRGRLDRYRIKNLLSYEQL
jgi:hypothetical protein